MLTELFVLFLATTLSQASVLSEIKVRPNCEDGQKFINGKCYEIWRSDIDKFNVVTVPPNCPSGYVWINGKCREVLPRNVVTVPPNCPPGSQWINGECKEVWPANIVTVPPNCPPGFQWINGQCREVWPRNAITVPPNCKPGFEWINDQCREVWPANVITVPPNCPPGQEWINGACRDVWNKIDAEKSCTNGKIVNNKCIPLEDIIMKAIFNFNEKNELKEQKDQEGDIQSQNIISVPNQCPNGYKPDIHGVCRPVWGV